MRLKMEKNFEREVLDRLIKIEAKIDDYKDFKQDTTTALTLSNENKKEIEEIQDKIKWISRTVLGAIITGLVGLVFILIKIGMKIN